MLTKLKLLLWHLNLWPNRCPFCGLRLIVHGFEGISQRWTCPSERCGFNKGKA